MPPFTLVQKRTWWIKSPFFTHISFQLLPHSLVLQFCFSHFLLNPPNFCPQHPTKTFPRSAMTMWLLSPVVISHVLDGLDLSAAFRQPITCFIETLFSFCFQDIQLTWFFSSFSDFYSVSFCCFLSFQYPLNIRIPQCPFIEPSFLSS